MTTEAKLKRQKWMTLTGNEAIGWGARLARVPLTFIFPIGPSDEVGETMGQFYSSGELKGEILELEGEDATVSAVAAAAANGVRTLFSTNSQGIQKGWACFSTMGNTPVVTPVPHRLLSRGYVAPDWMDHVILRDVGWILINAENCQECLDMMLQCYKIAEDPSVQLPISLGYEGWEISHSDEPVLVPAQEDVDRFLPPYRGPNEWAEVLKEDWREIRAVRRGRMARMIETSYPEINYNVHKAMANAKELLKRVDKEYGNTFGRYWGGPIDDRMCQGAEVVLVTMCGFMGTARIAAEIARDRGIKAGVLKVRMYNPFPNQELRAALKGAKAVVALDRDESAILYNGLRSALYAVEPRPKVIGRIAGLSGTSVNLDEMAAFFEEGALAAKGGTVPELGWLLKATREVQGVAPDPKG